MNGAFFVQKAFVSIFTVLNDIPKGPVVAVIQTHALIFTREGIFCTEVVSIYNIIEARFAGVIIDRIGTISIINQRRVGSCYTIFTRFQIITSLEQKAFHVICWVIVDAEHGEKFAIFNSSAFSLARSPIGDIMKKDINNVVQSYWTRSVGKRTVILTESQR